MLKKKYPETLPRFHALVIWSGLRLIANPNEKAVLRYIRLTASEDAPILAGAASGRCDFLLTLDRAHLLNADVRKAKLPFKIGTPGDFFQRFWN